MSTIQTNTTIQLRGPHSLPFPWFPQRPVLCPPYPANSSPGYPQACLLRGGVFLEVSMTLVLGGDESPLTPSGQMFYASSWRVGCLG